MSPRPRQTGVALARRALATAPGFRATAAGTPLFRGAGGYTGARSSRALGEWDVRYGSADQVSLPDLPTLRARSHDLLRNAPIAVGAAQTTVTNTIGAGLTVQPAIDRDYLELTQEAADAWELQAERIFLAWATNPDWCDIAGRLDFYTQQSVVEHAEWADGDCFALRRYLPRPGDLIALKLQLIEADRVSNPNFAMDTDRLAGGIETDVFGRPVRIHVLERNPFDGLLGGQRWEAVPAFGPESQERLILHQLAHKRIGQTRGIPVLAPVIETLKQLDRYASAELMASVVASYFTVFIKSPQAAGLGELGAITENAGGAATAPAIPKGEYRLGPAAMIDLAPGEEIELADPKRPNQAFDPFMLAFLRFVGAATEIPFEILVKHFSASYSASRAALLEHWRAVLTRRARRVRQFCQPVYGWVIAEAVARGFLDAPGFFEDPLARLAWCRADWNGPTMGQLNPLDEINAAEKRVNLTVSTLAEETAQLTGGSWERKFSQRVKEHRMLDEAGLLGEQIAERVAVEPVEPTPAPGGPQKNEKDDLGPGEDPR